MTNDLFRVVVADPPWAFRDGLRMSKVKRGAASHYSTMALNQLRDLDIYLDDLVALDAVLALWVPSALLNAGLSVMAAWGFEQKQVYTWVKLTKAGKQAFGMGHFFRGATEHALVGTRGNPRARNRSQRNVDLAESLPHSAKPEKLQERLEAMLEGPYLEMFARRDRPGWTCTGLECPSTLGVDIQTWLRRQQA